jgi:hypothetical protein
VNQLLGESVLILAMLVMVCLVLIPWRVLRVAVVLGWAPMWLDNEISGHWSDWFGALVLISSLGVFVSARHQDRVG